MQRSENVQLGADERGLFPVCVLCLSVCVCACVNTGTLTQSTRKWVCEPVKVPDEGGRVFFEMWQRRKKKKKTSITSSNFKAGYFPIWRQGGDTDKVCGLFMPTTGKSDGVDVLLVPNLHSPLTLRCWAREFSRQVLFVTALSKNGLPSCLRRRWVNSADVLTKAYLHSELRAAELQLCAQASLCAAAGVVEEMINHHTRAEVNTNREQVRLQPFVWRKQRCT